MNFGCLRLLYRLRVGLIFLLVVSFSLPAHSASFVLGKQYLLKPKRQLSSLIWYAVTFDKSITGGLKVTLKVYSDKGQSLDYLDEYRDFVSPEIAQRAISKFSLTEYRMVFNDQKKSELGFQTNSIGDVMYLPLKVKYADGFEDYLVRIRIKGGKFAISTRPLQHGMLTQPAENAVENFRAEKAKQKETKRKQDEEKKAKLETEKKRADEEEARRLKAKQEEAIKNSPAISINDELFNPDNEDLDEMLKESESKFEKKEQKAKGMIKSDDDLYSQPLQTDPAVAPVDNIPASEMIKATEEEKVLEVPAQDDAMDNLFKDGGAASDKPKANDLPFDDGFGDFEDEAPKSKDKDKSKDKSSNKKDTKAAAPAIETDEIEIEGFDKALEEIEKLEGLEGL